MRVHSAAPSIRAYAPASGAVDLLAGSGAEPSPEIVVNNAAPASVGISGMASLAWRNGTLWVGTNSLLHAIDLAANMLTTVSGDGTAGFGGPEISTPVQHSGIYGLTLAQADGAVYLAET
ncbi:hypothetical protein MNEG_10064 [Monoraphidium neglectum]|uniref:Uncharacterized protein n=1 Tax=Monoraphidium neglectum TaxID=145388 RepID=A0A0D2M2N0_9CHLO|nr:hypothetical protein MNEG_10064 [Monoraphidium neglectum]KIY97899.1 hypothetical protein MNEG_10064 [Monoraphidium neglectum]|eukprot:XP_013896919.1 hypothetical protein MNEG_10064 [Monoraphidium neglectum]